MIILRSGAVYLCGHLHTLAEVVPRMYAVHTDGHLELELGDWLDTRKYVSFFSSIAYDMARLI